MKGRMAPFASWIKFGGPIILLKVCEDVAAAVDPCRIAETADRADYGSDKLTGSE